MLHRFRSYQLSVPFFRLAQGTKAPAYLKNQLMRAASSISLNLCEGSAKSSVADRRRFYLFALGSIRECEAIVELLSPRTNHMKEPVDKLARHVYRLVQAIS